ncbi:MAG: SurA N-terminal domain-containing protein [Candidatus Doudnabacteria bacterium]|nr:SurA N-terminal domain-containing protein [Candidatus Doudnabacteria bacterium]
MTELTTPADETALTNEPKKKFNPKWLAAAVIVILAAGAAFYFRNLLVAATVDGHIISRLSVVKRLEKQSGSSVLNSLIDDQLISNAAANKKITISEDEINAKLDKIKSQVEASGSDMDTALKNAGLTAAELRQQIVLQLKLEKLLSDKLNVSDEEVAKYIADNKVTIAAGKEKEIKDQVREQIKTQKFNNEATTYLSDQRNNAKIKTFVNY